MSIPTYLTLTEVARQTGEKYPTIHSRVVKQRVVPSIRQGGIYLIHYRHLNRLRLSNKPSNSVIHHPLYRRWQMIKYRGVCCREWLNFKRFLEDVEALPKKGPRLWRIDLTKKYSKTNVRWG